MSDLSEIIPSENAAENIHDWNTTTVNVLLGLPGMFSTFNTGQLLRLRCVAIVGSSLSIIVGIISIYYLVNLDKRRKVFRHDLILFLIVCDLLKAMILMIYPVAILANDTVYAKPAFFNTLGWFTAYSIEGSDIAIFVFAIHFALLIFKPNRKWKNKRTGNMEGGLYNKRAFIWPVTALIPSILASLAFINYNKYYEHPDEASVVLDNNSFNFPDEPRVGGYKPWSAWCYLPPKPYWYKLVLSWGPRYFLMIFIVGTYISIYVFVSSKMIKIRKQLDDFRHQSSEVEDNPPTLTKYFLLPVLSILRGIANFLSLSLEDPRGDESDISFKNSDRGSSATPMKYDDSTSRGMNQGIQILSYDKTRNESKLAHKLPYDIGSSHNLNYPKERSDSNDEYHHRLEHHSAESESEIETSRADQILHELNRNSPEFSGDGILSASIVPDGDDHRADEEVEMINLKYEAQLKKKLCQGEKVDEVKKSFQRQTYADLKRRRAHIQKNLRSIFIYPCSYIATWLFALIADCLQYRYEESHGPVVGISYIDTFCRPLSALINGLVYLYRERPWRYSWDKIESKVIEDKYQLKGEIGEKAILELCNNKWGRRGWFYRGRSMKLECWRYKSQWWKRAAWYIYRTLKGIKKLRFDYTDNCHDFAYWDSYYLGRNSNSISSGSDAISRNGRNKQFLDMRSQSYPLDSSSSEYPGRSHPTEPQCSIGFVKCNIFWRIVHSFPMLHGVDLDELDRKIKLRYQDDNFVIPGLEFALKDKRNNEIADDQKQSNNNMFRNSYTLQNSADPRILDNIIENESDAVPPTSSIQTFDGTEENGGINDTISTDYNESHVADDGMDLLDFLNEEKSL